MNWWQRVLRRWRLENELDAELDFHFDRLVADFLAAGLSERDARARARQEFGRVEEVKEACRDARGTRWVHDVVSDVQFSVRLLIRERALTATAVLALGVGMGVNNTLFTIVNAICLRGLPVDEPARVVDISARDQAHRALPLSIQQFDRLVRARPETLEGAAAYAAHPATLRDEDRAADRVTVGFVSVNTFALLRRQPFLGRDFRPDDDRQGGVPVALIGDDLWRTRYAADPEIIGRPVIIDGRTAVVVGVMPRAFRFPDNADLWQPLSMMQGGQIVPAVTAVGRLASGATVAQARESVTALLNDASSPAGGAITVAPINDRYRADIRDPAWLAFITTGLLLVVIACSNVANLLLAAGVRRRREVAIRLSLGATRGRIVRQLLVETAMLALCGAVLALAVSAAGLRIFTAALPANALPYWVKLTVDGRVLAVLSVVCIGTAFLSGTAPALQLSRTTLDGALQSDSRGTGRGPGAGRWTGVFLTVQLALTVILLSAVGLTVQSFYAQRVRDPFIDSKRLLTAIVTLPRDAYPTADRRQAFFQALEERVVSTGHATAMSVASGLPAGPTAVRRLLIEGRPPATAPLVRTVAVDGHYFRTLGLPIVAGRAFAPAVSAATPAPAIVNQRFAELFLAGQEPVGRGIRLADPRADPGSRADALTIVGVAASLRAQPTLDPEPLVYLLLPEQGLLAAVLLLRTEGDPGSLAAPLREVVRRLDRNVPLSRVMTLDEANWEARWNARVSAGLISTIALIALGLAAVGLAALTSHIVGQRRRELGIRLALGATERQVVFAVLARVLIQLAVGLLFGAIGAAAWQRLFGTSGLTDVANMAAVALVVTTVTVAAAAWPAIGAARIDPLTSLRSE